MPPRTRQRRAVLAAPLCAGVLALSALPASAAPDLTGLTLSIPTTAAVGDTLTLELSLWDTADVYAYALTVDVDPHVLAVVPDSATGPEGGFDSTEVTGADATVVHSRLGSSPALTGALDASVELAVVGPGTTNVEVTIELVGSDGTTTTVPAGATADIVVAPPEPTPTDPEPEPTEPEPSPTDAAPSPSPTDDDDGAPAPTAAPPAQGGGSLPSTGLDALGLGAAAAVLAGIGGSALLARRRTGGAL